MEGLEHMKEHFKLFKRLRVLNLSSNKLCLMPNHRTENLRDMLMEVKETLEELHLAENTIENKDFDILAPAIAKMSKLRYLNCTKNRIWGPSLRGYLDLLIANDP